MFLKLLKLFIIKFEVNLLIEKLWKTFVLKSALKVFLLSI